MSGLRSVSEFRLGLASALRLGLESVFLSALGFLSVSGLRSVSEFRPGLASAFRLGLELESVFLSALGLE